MPSCAWPFGAVRLAERPSCRTAQPGVDIPNSAPVRRSTAPQPSPRAKPSARLSNVWLLPVSDGIPAADSARPKFGVRIRLTPSAKCSLQSWCSSARIAE
eukprot:5455982-Prymnesium_polylepis.1